MSIPSIVLRTPGLKLVGLSLLLMGAYGASIHPFQSLIAIRALGLAPSDFALVLVLASAVSVTSSVLLGILSDRLTQRRRMAILTSAVGTAGLGLMMVAPGQASFVLCHGIAVPFTASLVGQYFALGRLSLTPRPQARTPVLAALRAGMSGTFLATLLAWNGFLRGGGALLHIYAGAFAVSAATTFALWRWWPEDNQAHWQDAPSGLRLTDAVAEMLRPAIRWRLLFMGWISGVTALFGTLMPLIFAATPQRSPGDNALYWAIVAGWEVPVMLLLPVLARHLSRSRLLALGGFAYALHILLVQVMAGSPLVWGLTLLGGASGAAIFGLQITYLQDLLHERPGTAGALLAIQKLVGDLTASAAFAIGSALGGYHVAALIGSLLGGVGALGILLADRHAEPAPRPQPQS